MTFPNLSAVEGWDEAWVPTTGQVDFLLAPGDVAQLVEAVVGSRYPATGMVTAQVNSLSL